MPQDQAKGYGLWVAKVVAARTFGRKREDKPASDAAPSRRRKWHALGDEPQTDKLFDREIVKRMGADFYRDVFGPAIRDAHSRGQTYESIRDRLRRRWKPAERTATAG